MTYTYLATVIDDAIRFVSQKSKERLKSPYNTNEVREEESNEPDYNEDKEEQKEVAITTNQVFLNLVELLKDKAFYTFD
jgi:hypothetical protein